MLSIKYDNISKEYEIKKDKIKEMKKHKEYNKNKDLSNYENEIKKLKQQLYNQ